MPEITASRTLVKSPPELWAECSDAQSLARHLGEFGEIRITKLEPETAVAWEGEEFSGTVRLEPSGWGTRVVITASTATASAAPVKAEAPPDPEIEAEEIPAPQFEPPPARVLPRRGLIARLLGLLGLPPAPEPGPPASPPPPPRAAVPEPSEPGVPAGASEPAPVSEPERHLNTALDSLGQAHRRPFSHG